MWPIRRSKPLAGKPCSKYAHQKTTQDLHMIDLPTYKRAGDKFDLYKRAGDKFDLSKRAGDEFNF